MVQINQNVLFYLLISICIFLLVLAIFFPQVISWLIVLVFVSLIMKLCYDGIKIRKQMLENNQLDRISKNLSYELDNLLRRFSGNQLYKINKISILDKIFRDNIELHNWEKNQRYYQNLPNLLLSFGLLGTFVGITINLFLLSRNTGGEIPLDKTLEDIIGSMAIAFISSLTALVGSVVITKFYPAYDLEVAKQQIFNQLEYYLDNECQILLDLPSINEKIDVLIQCLSNLPQSVNNLEKSVSTSAQKITTSADNFQTKIQNTSNIISTTTNILNDTINNLTTITQDFANFTSTLTTSSTSLDRTTKELANYHQQLQTAINNLNNHSSRIHNLIQSNHHELSQVSLRLEDNCNSLVSSTQAFNVNTAEVKAALNNHTSQVGIHNSSLQQLSSQITNNSQIWQQIQKDLQEIAGLLNQKIN